MVAQKKIVKRQLWINLALGVPIAALVWVVFFKADTPGVHLYPLSSLSPSQVDKIVIAPAQQPRIVLHKRQNTWFVIEPLSARADAARIANLLGLLAAQSEKRIVTTDLGRFELDKPLARLTLGSQEFDFGSTQPLSNQLYVHTQAAVYLISPVYFVDVAKQPNDYVAKQLLAPDENPVAFEFATFKLIRSDGKWQKEPQKEPGDAALSQDDANKFADEWRHAQAFAVSQPATFQAAEHITLRFASGKSLTLQAAQQGQEWIVLRADEKLAYHFMPDAARRLHDLRPPSKN